MSSFHYLILRPAQKLVADAAHGFDVVPAGFQLPANVADMHVDGAVERRSLPVVEVLHQIVARDHPSRGPHQRFEDVELEGGEIHEFALRSDLARGWF